MKIIGIIISFLPIAAMLVIERAGTNDTAVIIIKSIKMKKTANDRRNNLKKYVFIANITSFFNLFVSFRLLFMVLKYIDSRNPEATDNINMAPINAIITLACSSGFKKN